MSVKTVTWKHNIIFCPLNILFYLIKISLWIKEEFLKMFMYDGEKALQRHIVHMHVHGLWAMCITLLKNIILKWACSFVQKRSAHVHLVLVAFHFYNKIPEKINEEIYFSSQFQNFTPWSFAPSLWSCVRVQCKGKEPERE